MGDLVAKAESARVARDAAEQQLAELHAAMLDEIAKATPHGYTGKRYGLDILHASFGQANTAVVLPELVIEALCFYGRVAAILPPHQGEGVQQHARRVNDWIADKWRKERAR